MTSEREKREKSVSELDENQKVSHQEAELEGFPSSLLRYFETSRRRAAACEKLLLEDLDDETVESQTGFSSESSNNEAEPETSWGEDMETGGRRQRREEDFQRELRKIMEAEKEPQKPVEQLKISREEEEEEKKNNEEKKQHEEVRRGGRQEEAWRKPVEMQRQMEGGKKKMNEKWREDEDVVKKTSENEKKWTEDEVKKKEENRKQHQHKREQTEEEERKKTEERLRGRVTNKKRTEKESTKEDEEKLLEEVQEVNSKGEERKMESECGLQDERRTLKEEERETRGTAEEREKLGRRGRPEEEMKETNQKMLNESEDNGEDEEQTSEEESHNEEKQKILQENSDVDEENQDGQKRCDERWTDDDESLLKGKKPQEHSKTVNGHENGKLDGETLQEEEKRVILMNGGRDGKEDNRNKVMMISTAELQTEKELHQSLNPADNVLSGSSMTGLIRPKTPLHCLLGKDTPEESTSEAGTSTAEACAPCWSVVEGLPESAEQKRLSWRKNCMSWSTLSLQNRSRPKGSVQTQGRPMKKADRLPPLSTDALLQAAGQRPLQEVTTVTLEKLSSCSLSSLVQCPQLRSLSLRRCGLRALEGLQPLQELCYVDLRENDISHVDCENMTSLRVLRLGHNKLTSIHGLSGAENLDVLDLSYNSITRVAGLESLRRLQRLLLDHNRLINTRGLKDVYTLLHLSCAHNHLETVEGLESSRLLHTLDLTANSLTEPPRLNNQVLLRELHLDDNCISSLQGLADCWLPLLQNLSARQNQITQLPSMTDFISLENLDLRFNCLSEVLNVCENLQGCHSLGQVWLSGNPVLQEREWRCVLQKAVPGLRAIDGRQSESSTSASAAQRVSSAPGSFLTICWEQLQQTQDLQQLHSTELSSAAVVIQQRWRKYRQQRGNTNLIDDEEELEHLLNNQKKCMIDDEEELEHLLNNHRKAVAATVIQAFWRGFTLRRKLASALAAVEDPDGEDDTFQEDFVFEEPNLDKYWTDFEDSSLRHCPVTEAKPTSCSHPSCMSSVSPMQAWTAAEHGFSAFSTCQKKSPKTSSRSKSPPSTFVCSGVSESSQRILEEWGFTDRKTAFLMLKRAQRMKSTKDEEEKRKNPSVGLEIFRHQLGPVEAQSRPAGLKKVSTVKLELQQLKRTELRGPMQTQR
ncbi:hypothetical protein OJAV_G00050170 [Oryzias javanicus]|uniref:Leucine-rich repeat and IQ domain-containing protein 1 n=1 Tax=Oryzias javanicus TaxID=123683 RepID=A0A3S2PN85_ORYJA|nr:hypothetical protein OJAV_G00050170 [Oryzias javanicus]